MENLYDTEPIGEEPKGFSLQHTDGRRSQLQQLLIQPSLFVRTSVGVSRGDVQRFPKRPFADS